MTQTQKPLGLASDHAGFELKQFVKTYLDKHAIKQPLLTEYFLLKE